MSKNYFIKSGYITNSQPKYYVDTFEESLIYQVDVYKYVRDIIKKENISNILDIGCGHGTKLKDYILPVCKDITGLDLQESIDYCVINYDFGNWYVDNIEDPIFPFNRKFDFIMSSDVIEHLDAPDMLLDYIRRFISEKGMVVLSTPERDLRRGADDFGPPGNHAHIREWNLEEFGQYLRDRGLEILDHRVVDLKEGMSTCQLVLCRF